MAQRVGFGLEIVNAKHYGHDDQQPEQRVLADFFHSGFMAGIGWDRTVMLVISFLTKTSRIPCDQGANQACDQDS